MEKHRIVIAVLLVITAAIAWDRTWERTGPWNSPAGKIAGWQSRPTAARKSAAAWLRRQLTWRDQGSIRALVLALNSGQPQLAVAARSVAHEKIDEWQLLPPVEAAARLGELAAELQARLPGASPEFAGPAVELLSRIARCCPDAVMGDRIREVCFTMGPSRDRAQRRGDGGGDHAREAIARDLGRLPWRKTDVGQDRAPE